MESTESLTSDGRRGSAAPADADSEVVRRFSRRLAALARRRMPLWLRAKTDPEDVLQSVFRSFFRRRQDDQFRLATWDDLWALLALITARKCDNARRRYDCLKRDARREVGLDSRGEDARSRDPTPSEAASLTEVLDILVRRLSERDREVLALYLEGHDVETIAARIQRAERTVRRALDRVYRTLEEMRCEEDAEPSEPARGGSR